MTIIIFLITLIFLLIISGLCRSIVHTLLHHYPEFKKKWKIKNDQWWNPAVSHVNKDNIKWTIDIFGFRWVTKILVQFSDAFHTFNTIELISDNIRESLYFSTLVYYLYGLLINYTIAIFFAALLFHGGIKILISFNYGYDKLWR